MGQRSHNRLRIKKPYSQQLLLLGSGASTEAGIPTKPLWGTPIRLFIDYWAYSRSASSSNSIGQPPNLETQSMRSDLPRRCLTIRRTQLVRAILATYQTG